MSGKDPWNPRILVSPVPDSHTDASGYSPATLNHGSIVLGLLGDCSGGSRRVGADIELGDGDVDSQGGESTHVGCPRGYRFRAGGTNDEMSLHADAIDFHAVRLNELDDVLRAGGFGACSFDVVVVVVELGGGICSCGCSESDRDVRWADGVVEDVRAVGTILVESFKQLEHKLVEETGHKPSFTTSHWRHLPL